MFWTLDLLRFPSQKANESDGNFHLESAVKSEQEACESSELNLVELSMQTFNKSRMGSDFQICWNRVSNENTRIIYVKTSHCGAIPPQVVNENWRNAYSSPGQNVQKIQVKTLVNKKQKLQNTWIHNLQGQQTHVALLSKMPA